MTLWKNRDAIKEKKVNKYPKIKLNKKMEESSKIENDFIDNLKKQIYFMEMELNLMKERERDAYSAIENKICKYAKENGRSNTFIK